MQNTTNNQETSYMMLLNIKVPQAEHARIQAKLSEISSGTSKAIYFDKHGGAFLFKTTLKAQQIYDRLIGTLLNDDRYIIVELGTDWTTFGHEDAAGWLRKYLNS